METQTIKMSINNDEYNICHTNSSPGCKSRGCTRPDSRMQGCLRHEPSVVQYNSRTYCCAFPKVYCRLLSDASYGRGVAFVAPIVAPIVAPTVAPIVAPIAPIVRIVLRGSSLGELYASHPKTWLLRRKNKTANPTNSSMP